MRVKTIIKSLLKFIDREDINTLDESEDKIDKNLLDFLLEHKENNTYNFLILAFSFIKYNKISVEKIIPTFNKFFRLLGLEPVNIKYKKEQLIYYKKDKADNTYIQKIFEYISTLFDMFFNFESKPVDINVQIDDFILYLQDWSHDEYKLYLDKLVKIADKKYIFQFLKTAWIYTGNELYGFKSVFNFLNAVKKYDNVISDILNFYFSIFIEYSRLFNKNAEFKINSKKINLKQLDRLSNKLKISRNLWFAPLLRLYEDTYANLKERMELDQLRNEYFEHGKTAVFNHFLLKYHYFKLLDITIWTYNAARIAFKNGAWLKNDVIEKIIEILENSIQKYMSDKRFIPDQRFLSLKAAKDWIKFNYNIYNVKWDPFDIAEQAKYELELIIKRKNYLHDSMVVGKVIEVLSKLQDYCNRENIDLDLEKIYNDLLYEFKTIEHIRSTAELSCETIYKPYEWATRFTKNHEMSMSFLSGIKFVLPSLVSFEDVKTFNYFSMEYIHDYWTYFSKLDKRDYERLKIIKNSILGYYI